MCTSQFFLLLHFPATKGCSADIADISVNARSNGNGRQSVNLKTRLELETRRLSIPIAILVVSLDLQELAIAEEPAAVVIVAMWYATTCTRLAEFMILYHITFKTM